MKVKIRKKVAAEGRTGQESQTKKMSDNTFNNLSAQQLEKLMLKAREYLSKEVLSALHTKVNEAWRNSLPHYDQLIRDQVNKGFDEAFERRLEQYIARRCEVMRTEVGISLKEISKYADNGWQIVEIVTDKNKALSPRGVGIYWQRMLSVKEQRRIADKKAAQIAASKPAVSKATPKLPKKKFKFGKK